MPSLKLRSLFRRDPERPSLRERAAATSSRVKAFKAAAPDPVPASPSDLTQACDQAIVDWNAISPRSQAEDWGDEHLDEALDAYGAVFRRAIVEPSREVDELRAKARLLLHDLHAHDVGQRGEATLTDDRRLTRVILREVAKLSSSTALIASADLIGRPSPSPDLTPDRAWAVAQAAAVDLSALTILQLHNLYVRFSSVADIWCATSSLPWASDKSASPFRDLNAAGHIVEREEDRAAEFRSRLVAEIRARVPTGDFERNWRLETLIQHELLCESSLQHAPDLRAEINEAWGG